MALRIFGSVFAICYAMQHAGCVGLKTPTLAIVKPDAADNGNKIKDELVENGFVIVKDVNLMLQEEAVAQFYEEHERKPFFQEVIQHMGGKPLRVFVLEREDAVATLRRLIGPTDPAEAKVSHPESLRARLGTNKTANAIHAPDSDEAALREINYFFPSVAKKYQKWKIEL